MASQIVDGSSLSGTTTSQISAGIGTNRNCCIEIVNYSGQVLTDPNSYCKSGYCYLPLQPSIQSQTRETCSFSKAAEAPTGSVGVLTYQLDESIRLAIMFSVPYDYNFYDNWFGLALIESDFQAGETLYEQMYNDAGFDNQPDKKRAKAKSGGTLHVERNGWKISATMSDAKRAIIHVDVSNPSMPPQQLAFGGYGVPMPPYPAQNQRDYY